MGQAGSSYSTSPSTATTGTSSRACQERAARRRGVRVAAAYAAERGAQRRVRRAVVAGERRVRDRAERRLRARVTPRPCHDPSRSAASAGVSWAVCHAGRCVDDAAWAALTLSLTVARCDLDLVRLPPPRAGRRGLRGAGVHAAAGSRRTSPGRCRCSPSIVGRGRRLGHQPGLQPVRLGRRRARRGLRRAVRGLRRAALAPAAAGEADRRGRARAAPTGKRRRRPSRRAERSTTTWPRSRRSCASAASPDAGVTTATFVERNRAVVAARRRRRRSRACRCRRPVVRRRPRRLRRQRRRPGPPRRRQADPGGVEVAAGARPDRAGRWRRDGFQGVLAYTLREALWLHEQGISDDIVVAYPTVDRGALARAGRLAVRGGRDHADGRRRRPPRRGRLGALVPRRPGPGRDRHRRRPADRRPARRAQALAAVRHRATSSRWPGPSPSATASGSSAR